jgi:hypothetical protein
MFGSSNLHDVRVVIHRERVSGEPEREGNDWLYDEERCHKYKAMSNVQPRSASSDRLAIGRGNEVQDDGGKLPFYSYILQTNFLLEIGDILEINGKFYEQSVRPFDDVEGKRNYCMTLLKKL